MNSLMATRALNRLKGFYIGNYVISRPTSSEILCRNLGILCSFHGKLRSPETRLSKSKQTARLYHSQSQKLSKPNFLSRPPVRVSFYRNTEGKFELKKLNDSVKSLDCEIIEQMNDGCIEEATDLIISSSEKNGKLPSGSTILILLQNLAEKGNMETILQLREIALRTKLCSELNFIKCLCRAFCESGRLEEAYWYLKIQFEKNRRYKKIKTHFVLLSVIVFKDFTDSYTVDFVNYLKKCGVTEIEQDLWKCYVLAGNFKKAESVLSNNQMLKKKISQIVSEIFTAISIIDNEDLCNEELVWKYLSENGERFGLKRKLLVTINEYYLVRLCKNEKYGDVLRSLKKLQLSNMKIHRNIFVLIWRFLENYDLCDEELDLAGEIFNWYHEQYLK